MTAILPNLDELWDFTQPAVSEQRFRDRLPELATSANRTTHAELLTQIARAQGLQGAFSAAHATLDEAATLVNDDAERDRAHVRLSLERGRLHNSSGQPAAAIPHFIAAWELARRAGEDALAVDAAHMLAIAEPPDRQTEWNRQALALSEQSPNPRARVWLGSLYNNMAWAHHDAGEDDEALALFEKALAWRQEHGEPREIQIARWSVARALRSLHRISDALAILRALDAELTATGDSDPYVDEELGECLLAIRDHRAAWAHLSRAYPALSQDSYLIANEYHRLARLEALVRDMPSWDSF